MEGGPRGHVAWPWGEIKISPPGAPAAHWAYWVYQQGPDETSIPSSLSEWPAEGGAAPELKASRLPATSPRVRPEVQGQVGVGDME